MGKPLGFWTPVTFGEHQKTWGEELLQKIDDYFSLSGRKVTLAPLHYVGVSRPVVPYQEKVSYLTTTLKIVSYCTVVIPAIALAMKAVLRTIYHFHYLQDPAVKIDFIGIVNGRPVSPAPPQHSSPPVVTMEGRELEANRLYRMTSKEVAELGILLQPLSFHVPSSTCYKKISTPLSGHFSEGGWFAEVVYCGEYHVKSGRVVNDHYLVVRRAFRPVQHEDKGVSLEALSKGEPKTLTSDQIGAWWLVPVDRAHAFTTSYRVQNSRYKYESLQEPNYRLTNVNDPTDRFVLGRPEVVKREDVEAITDLQLQTVVDQREGWTFLTSSRTDLRHFVFAVKEENERVIVAKLLKAETEQRS